MRRRVPSALANDANASSSSFEACAETMAAGDFASASRVLARSTAWSTLEGTPPSRAFETRSRNSTLCRSKPLLQIQGPLTSGLGKAVTRYASRLRSSADKRSCHSFLRRQMLTLQPRAQPVHTERTGSRYQLRLL